MARINLLPWRQEERERKNKEFNVVAAATAVLAVLVVLLATTLLNSQLSNQQDANNRIESEIRNLEAVISDIEGLEEQREQMLSRLKIVQDLQGQRSVPVRVWDDIARAIPDFMYLVGMKREGDTITLNGFSANVNLVSQLVRNLDASPWLDNSAVPNIQTDARPYAGVSRTEGVVAPESRYIRFTVTTQIKPDAASPLQVLDAEALSDQNTLSQEPTSNAQVANENGAAQAATDQSAAQASAPATQAATDQAATSPESTPNESEATQTQEATATSGGQS